MLLVSTMGVRARRIASVSEESKPSGGSCGSGDNPFVGAPCGGSFVEGRGCDEDALVFGDVPAASPCTLLNKISLRRDRTAEVRSSRGSMISAACRSIKSDCVRIIIGGEWI